MYPSHEEAPGPREVPWLNGRPATAAETPAVERARQAERDRETARLLAGVLTTADRPGVVPYAVSAREAVTVEAGEELL